MRFVLITFVLIFSSALFASAQLRRSLNQFEKGKYDTAFDILYKTLEKDSINPEVKHLISIYYLVDSFPDYNIDSSYVYIISSISDYNTLEPEDVDKLAKDNFNLDTLSLQKGLVEVAAFDSVKKVNSEAIYLSFLEQFPNSVKEDSAIILRNKSAYLDVEKVNTWPVYLAYMEKYPDALEYQRAKQKYEFLIYEDKTSDGKLRSYETFLSEYPDTPFKNECEESIFRIRTGSHKSQDYIDFIHSYPSSFLIQKSLNRMYHLDDVTLSDIKSLTSNRSLIDSLNTISKVNEGLLIPFLKDGNYGFYNSTFEPQIPPIYPGISSNYFCGNIFQDILLVKENETNTLINRENNIIYKNDLEEFEDLGSGLLKIKSNENQYGVFCKSGEMIMEPKWDDVVLLHKSLISVKSRGKWGIFSISNIQLVPLEFDSIFLFNDQYILQSDKYHFYREKDILLALDQEESSPFLSMDDYLVLDNERTIVFDGDLEGLLNNSGELEIMLGSYRIEPIKENTFIVKTDSSSYVFKPDNDDLSNFKWDDAKYNNNWLGLSIKDKWYVESLTNENHIKDIKDSLYFLTESILWTRHEEMDSLHFINGTSIPLPEKSKYKVLVSKNRSSFEKSYLYFNSKRDHFLINWAADTTQLPRDTKPKDVANEYLILDYKGKSGLYSSKGDVLLRPKYDAIVSNGDGTLDLLLKKKFGVYRLKDSLAISANSDRKVRFLNDSLIITHSDNQYHLSKTDETPLLGSGFSEFKFFNDTTAFFRSEDQWALVDIGSDSTLISNINNISLLSENEGSNTYKIYSNSGIGLLNNTNGLIIAPTFNEIINIGSYSNPFYIGEKYVSEADYYVLVYFNDSGEIKHRFAYPTEVYDALMCDKTE